MFFGEHESTHNYGYVVTMLKNVEEDLDPSSGETDRILIKKA